jgi:hypothetical protein
MVNLPSFLTILFNYLTIRYYSAVFHIRIRKLLGLTDPDPLVNGTDPDPSIIKQK